MTNSQKVIKYLALALAVIIIVGIVSGISSAFSGLSYLFMNSNGTTAQLNDFNINNELNSIDIDVSAAELEIKIGNKFNVQSNIENLSVKEKDGVLKISEAVKIWSNHNETPVLQVTIPSGFVFKKSQIETGVGSVYIESMLSKEIVLDFGAGEVKIDALTAYEKAKIDCGAGKVTISDGALNNLDLDMGVGQLNLTSALSEKSDFDCGVGSAYITLLGQESDYSIHIDKGIGSVKVNDKNVKDSTVYGLGANNVDIDCGVGDVDILFQ